MRDAYFFRLVRVTVPSRILHVISVSGETCCGFLGGGLAALHLTYIIYDIYNFSSSKYFFVIKFILLKFKIDFLKFNIDLSTSLNLNSSQ